MDMENIIKKAKRVQQLESEKKLLDIEIAENKEQIQDFIFHALHIKPGSRINLDLDDKYGLCKYIVLNVNVVEGEITVMVIRRKSAASIEHHTGNCWFEDGYAARYGVPATLDKFTKVYK